MRSSAATLASRYAEIACTYNVTLGTRGRIVAERYDDEALALQRQAERKRKRGYADTAG